MADLADIQPRQIQIRQSSLLLQIITDFNVIFSITPMPATEKIIFGIFCLLNRLTPHSGVAVFVRIPAIFFCDYAKYFYRSKLCPDSDSF